MFRISQMKLLDFFVKKPRFHAGQGWKRGFSCGTGARSGRHVRLKVQRKTRALPLACSRLMPGIGRVLYSIWGLEERYCAGEEPCAGRCRAISCSSSSR